jgi:hypothetical protein
MADFKAADMFLATFKSCVSKIINILPSDPLAKASEAAATNAIRIIATQLNGEFTRLQYVIEIIQARICEDPAWAEGMAATVYELLATSIDPAFSHPDPQMVFLQGALLVRDLMVRACQTQFTETVTAEAGWSRGLLAFLGQMCTVGRVTSTTPKIALHVLDCMLSSPALNDGDNFDIFLGYAMRAGPFLDSLRDFRKHLAERMHELQERTKAMGMTVGLAVYGIVQLREKGWQIEDTDGAAQYGQQVDVDRFTFL